MLEEILEEVGMDGSSGLNGGCVCSGMLSARSNWAQSHGTWL